MVKTYIFQMCKILLQKMEVVLILILFSESRGALYLFTYYVIRGFWWTARL